MYAPDLKDISAKLVFKSSPQLANLRNTRNKRQNQYVTTVSLMKFEQQARHKYRST